MPCGAELQALDDGPDAFAAIRARLSPARPSDAELDQLRSARVLRLLQVIGRGDYPSVAAVARSLRVSRRTVFRDLALLRQAGFDVAYDRDSGGFHLASPPGSGPRLSIHELLALVTAAQTARQLAVVPPSEALDEAIRKLKRVLIDDGRRDQPAPAEAQEKAAQ